MSVNLNNKKTFCIMTTTTWATYQVLLVPLTYRLLAVSMMTKGSWPNLEQQNTDSQAGRRIELVPTTSGWPSHQRLSSYRHVAPGLSHSYSPSCGSARGKWHRVSWENDKCVLDYQATHGAPQGCNQKNPGVGMPTHHHIYIYNISMWSIVHQCFGFGLAQIRVLNKYCLFKDQGLQEIPFCM